MNLLIIQARMGSSRLPGKVLKKINNKSILLHLIERVKCSKKINKIVVATTKAIKDQEIVEFCKLHKIDFFCGSEHDVLERFYKCALKYEAKNIIRITSDCPLIDPIVIDTTIDLYLKNDADYAANTIPPETRKWPDGSDVEVFSFNALEISYLSAKDDEREHVTFFMWRKNKNFKTVQLDNNEDWSKYRYTIDYNEDYEKVKKIMSILLKNNCFGHTKDIVQIIKDDGEMQNNNKKYSFGYGWKKNK